MKTKKRVLPAILFSIFAGAAATGAQAQQFSGVVVFGDSLSDAGYYRGFLAGIGIPAPLVATMGRWTTNPGPMWAELVSTHYGVASPGPSNAGGTIYAQGGARVALTPGITPPGQAERPIRTQITEHLCHGLSASACDDTHGGVADPGALYTMWGGANDFFVQVQALSAGAITPAQFQANVLAAAAAEVQQVGRLYQAGARYVLVFANYDPSFTPAISAADAATRAGFTQLGVGANTTVFAGLASNGLRVIPVDLFSLVNQIRANPSAYGFANTTGVACGPFPPITTTPSALFCYTGNLVAPNAAETYFFADSTGHVTTATNRIFAQFAESMIDGPAAYSLLAEAPLRARNGHIAALGDAIALGEKAQVGQFTAFATGGGGSFDVDTSTSTGLDSRNDNIAIGGTLRFSDSFLLGASYGQSHSRGSLGMEMGGFKTRENVWSIFGSVKMGGFYGNKRAISLYESEGFAEYCRRADYYGTGQDREDAVLMSRLFDFG